MNALAMFGAGFVVVGATVGYLVWDDLAPPDCPGNDSIGGVAASDEAFRLRLVLHNSANTDPTRVCMFDAAGTKIFDQTYAVSGDKGRYWDLYLPRAPDRWIADLPGDQGAQLEESSDYLAAPECQGVAPEFLHSRYGKTNYLISIDCTDDHPPQFPVEPGEEALQVQMLVAPAPDFGHSPPGAALAAGLGGGATFLVVFWLRRDLKWLLIGLFSRVLGPRVLDSGVRTHIHQLVTAEPGIRRSEIAERLELAAGQTVHHLRVLVREHLLAEVGFGPRKHYFLRGSFAADRMRQLAALRSAPLASFVHAVQQRPGAALSEVAALAGLSRPRASMVLRGCQAAGLVRSERSGRHVRIFPALRPHH